MSIYTFLANTNYFANLRWQHLLSKYKPNVFYDIGCNDPYDKEYGAVTFFKKIFPSTTEIYLFEAAEKHIDKIKQTGMPFHMGILGDEDGKKINFYESKVNYESGNGDSYYKENTKVYSDEYIIKNEMTMKKLDTVIQEKKWPYADIIKIDTQGSELDILKGADTCLELAKFVLVECSVQEYNSNCPKIDDIISFLSKYNFSIFDIYQCQYHNGQLLQIDIMFCKNNHPMMKEFKII